MKFLGNLERNQNFWYLLLMSFIFFILRLPSLFEPYWYGDEGVYQAVGLAIRNGRLLYKEIWENKPPLLYIFYSIFDSDQFALRLLSLIFGLASIFVFYKLAVKILSNKASLISTFVFTILFGLPVLEGNIANAENFMMLPILVCALILLTIKESGQTEKQNNKNLIMFLLSGIILGLSFLFKIVAVFDFAAFLLFAFLFVDEKLIARLKNKKYDTYEVKKILLFIGGFLAPITLITAFFIFKGAFSEFMNATFLSNVGYIGYGNKFIIPQGLLISKLLVLSLVIGVLFLKRQSIKKQHIFVYLWFSFSLFNAMFSQRPYTHYLLVLLPSFILLIGMIFSEKYLRKLTLIIFIITIFLISKTFTVYGKFLPYYGNFLSFINGNESLASYQRFFDRLTPLDYELASFVKANSSENDSIYTWGNNAQLYKLTDKLPPGRYTVAYHVTYAKTGISETQKSLEKSKPRIIIIMPYMNYYPFSLTNYVQRMTIQRALVYERTL